MRVHWWLRFIGGLTFGISLHSQCFDLSSTHLYQPEGRFQEWWDRPIWNAAPGEGKFRLDQQEYGKHPLHFAIFMGIAKKTEAGWIPFKRERQPLAFCDHSGPKGSNHCWLTPYETPSHAAVPDAYDHASEVWSLTKAGLLRYVYESTASGNPNGTSGIEHAVATLNLETGRYEMVIQNHDKGVYEWAVKGGLELWRNITFSAQAKLITATCPASLETISSRVVNHAPKMEQMEGLRPCVIKVIPKGTGSDPGFEFIQNPGSATSPQGCVVVHEEPLPNGAEKLSERLPGEK
jgi:hypothetical protein